MTAGLVIPCANQRVLQLRKAPSLPNERLEEKAAVLKRYLDVLVEIRSILLLFAVPKRFCAIM